MCFNGYNLWRLEQGYTTGSWCYVTGACGLMSKMYTKVKETLDAMSRNHKECEDNDFGLWSRRHKKILKEWDKDTITTFQDCFTATMNLLQSIASTLVNAKGKKVQIVNQMEGIGCMY